MRAKLVHINNKKTLKSCNYVLHLSCLIIIRLQMSHRNILIERIAVDAVGPKISTASFVEISVVGSLTAPCRVALDGPKADAIKFKVPIKECAQIKVSLIRATDELAATAVMVSNPGLISCRLVANSVSYSIQFKVNFGSPFDLSFASIVMGMRSEIIFDYVVRRISEKFWIYYALYFVFLWSVYLGNLPRHPEVGSIPTLNIHSIVISTGQIIPQNEFVKGCILLSNEPCSPAALYMQGTD